MTKIHKTKRTYSAFIFSKKIMGIGVKIDFIPPYCMDKIYFSFQLDLLFFRMWIDVFSKRNEYE